MFRIVSNGMTGSCDSEQIYGEEDPVFETREEAEAAAAALLPGAREVAPQVEFTVIEEASGM